MKTLKGAIVLAVVLVAAAGAWIFRYEPVQPGMVWDRWTHRTCAVDWSGDIRCAGQQ